MKPLLLTLFISISFLVTAQNTPVKKIEVIGKAEMEIVPDEIYVSIRLQEYKNGAQKVLINKLEAQLVDAVKSVGLPEENLRVQNISGYNWNWKKRKSEDFLTQKNFNLKVTDLKKMNALVEKLDPEGVNSMNVIRYSHSKKEEFNRDLKIQAILAAKKKAEYLLDAVGETLGGVIEVQENVGGNQYYPQTRVSNVAFESASAQSYQSNLEFISMKLSTEIKVVFEIQ